MNTSVLNPAEIKTASIRPTAERVARILSKDKPTHAERIELARTLWIVHHHDTKGRNSKLAGLDSISTCTLYNDFCRECQKDPALICSHCYAATQQKCHTALAEHNLINAAILQNVLFTRAELRAVNISTTFARIESFGEVANVTQARNYIRLIKANPTVHFGIWTKRLLIWAEAIQYEQGKPHNCTLVISSPRINAEAVSTPLYEKFVDHVFTVYDRAAVKSGIDINCGGKRCTDCIKARRGCYYRTTERNPREIREQIK